MFPCPPDLTQIQHINRKNKQNCQHIQLQNIFSVFAKAHTVESYFKNSFETLSYYSCIRITHPIAGASKWNHLFHLWQGIWWCRHLHPPRFAHEIGTFFSNLSPEVSGGFGNFLRFLLVIYLWTYAEREKQLKQIRCTKYPRKKNKAKNEIHKAKDELMNWDLHSDELTWDKSRIIEAKHWQHMDQPTPKLPWEHHVLPTCKRFDLYLYLSISEAVKYETLKNQQPLECWCRFIFLDA